jgi:hypothetical protein
MQMTYLKSDTNFAENTRLAQNGFCQQFFSEQTLVTFISTTIEPVNHLLESITLDFV